MFTLIGSLFNITTPFSLAVAGPVTDWLGIQMWYVVAGVLCGATGLMGFFIPAFVNIERNNNGYVAQDETQSATAAEVAVPVR